MMFDFIVPYHPYTSNYSIVLNVCDILVDRFMHTVQETHLNTRSEVILINNVRAYNNHTLKHSLLFTQIQNKVMKYTIRGYYPCSVLSRGFHIAS